MVHVLWIIKTRCKCNEIIHTIETLSYGSMYFSTSITTRLMLMLISKIYKVQRYTKIYKSSRAHAKISKVKWNIHKKIYVHWHSPTNRWCHNAMRLALWFFSNYIPEDEANRILPNFWPTSSRTVWISPV